MSERDTTQTVTIVREDKPRKRGRPPGSLNKATKEIRQHLMTLVQNNEHRVQEWLDELAKNDPNAALRHYMELMSFVLPKLRAVEHFGQGQYSINIVPPTFHEDRPEQHTDGASEGGLETP